jgi:hypothetical protein
LDRKPLWKSQCWINILIESTPCCRRGIENKEDHAWRVFNLGDWINLSFNFLHPCIVDHSMWGFLVGYLYGLMSLFYVIIPHLLYVFKVMKEIFYSLSSVYSIHYVILHKYCREQDIMDARVHEETLGE